MYENKDFDPLGYGIISDDEIDERIRRTRRPQSNSNKKQTQNNVPVTLQLLLLALHGLKYVGIFYLIMGVIFLIGASGITNPEPGADFSLEAYIGAVLGFGCLYGAFVLLVVLLALIVDFLVGLSK